MNLCPAPHRCRSQITRARTTQERSARRPDGPAELRVVTEEALRDLAFVLHATRLIKQRMVTKT